MGWLFDNPKGPAAQKHRELKTVFRKVEYSGYTGMYSVRENYVVYREIWTTGCKAKLQGNVVVYECFKTKDQVNAEWVCETNLRFPECP